MAFGGAAVFLAAGARTGQSRHNISEVTGLTLTNLVNPVADRANADVGALSSNGAAIDAVPANTLANGLPANFGPGPDNWAQVDVDALTVLLQDAGNTVTKLASSKALVANVNPAPAGSSITNANAEVLVHNLGAGAANALTIRNILEHTGIR
jgi:hypothetical protein